MLVLNLAGGLAFLKASYLRVILALIDSTSIVHFVNKLFKVSFYDSVTRFVGLLKKLLADSEFNSSYLKYILQGVLQQTVFFIWAGTQRVCMIHKNFLHNYDTKT